jgi:hypothetical protein
MTETLPRFALAVRQPWAWAIIHADKTLENRTWKRWMKDWEFRARVAILASAGMTQAEYWSAAEFMADLGVTCPAPDKLVRGAIIGSVEIVDNVWESDSPWFMGPGALVLREPVPTLPIVASGKLGFFEWKPSDKGIPEPAKWMLPAVQP